MSEKPPRYASLLSDLDLAGFRAIAAVLREGVILVDRDLRIRDLNTAAEEILGRPADELTGRPVCGLFGDGDCPRDTLARSLAEGRSIIDFQTKVTLPGGRTGQVLLRTAPLFRRQGRSDGVALILGDVTEETRLRRESQARDGIAGLIGSDWRMRELFELIARVAASDAAVLIRGESGTGKELVARALHDGSSRAAGPFVSVNCSALAETLLESELFGHVKGAYTGATSDRRGRFEEARGGTLFLDEIGDVSPVVQVKLLRVLQEHVITRVGENIPRSVDVRVVSATNRDLEGLLTSGRMREDFYYRIKVVRLDIPPLRERREDIPLLADYLLARHGADASRLDHSALTALIRYDWPGNVRELENALQHALVLSHGGSIGSQDLPTEVTASAGPGGRDELREVARGSSEEKELLARALNAVGWNRTRAARKLGIDRSTLWRKIKEHGLEPDHEDN